MAITGQILGQINSFLKANIAVNYGVNCVDHSSLAHMVTFFFIIFLAIIHNSEQSQKSENIFTTTLFARNVAILSRTLMVR